MSPAEQAALDHLSAVCAQYGDALRRIAMGEYGNAHDPKTAAKIAAAAIQKAEQGLPREAGAQKAEARLWDMTPQGRETLEAVQAEMKRLEAIAARTRLVLVQVSKRRWQVVQYKGAVPAGESACWRGRIVHGPSTREMCEQFVIAIGLSPMADSVLGRLVNHPDLADRIEGRFSVPDDELVE